MKKLVVVYGSLRTGMSNHSLLEGQEFLGMDVLHGWDMHDLRSYPAVVWGKGSITVEVWSVSEDAYEAIEWLEGYPEYYDRVPVQTVYGPAEMYVLEGAEHLPAVLSGDWVAHTTGKYGGL